MECERYERIIGRVICGCYGGVVLCLKGHGFREGSVRFGVGKIIRTVLDTVVDIKVATFAAAVVFVQELGFYR